MWNLPQPKDDKDKTLHNSPSGVFFGGSILSRIDSINMLEMSPRRDLNSQASHKAPIRQKPKLLAAPIEKNARASQQDIIKLESVN